MPSAMKIARQVATLGLVAPVFSAHVRGGVAATPGSDSKTQSGVLEPLNLHQQFLFCNAFTSDTLATVKRNDNEVLFDDGGIPFNSCRYSDALLKTQDKLEFNLAGVGDGTFEVGALPESDAILLLVIGRRAANSSLLAFQSFAFPVTDADRDAQVAVIDAFQGNANVSAAQLRMADHHVGKLEKTVSKRVELLNFNRIYSVEEGTYDASLVSKAGSVSGEVLHLKKNQNYIVMRTGDGERFGQSLMIFPQEQAKSSASRFGAFALFTAMLSLM